jgi:hypothetical protein
MDRAGAVLPFLREYAAGAPDEVGMMANLRLAPPLPVVPEALHGTPIVALVFTYAGPVHEGEATLRLVRDNLPAPAIDALVPKPYAAHQKMFDAALPHGRHYYWKSHRLGPLGDDTIDVLIDQASKITSPLSSVALFTFGGAVARVPDDATAFRGRDAAHDINVVASWMPDDPAPARHVEWVRDFHAALEPWSRGVYVNFTSDDAAERTRRDAYGDALWSRLVALKSKYDPTNFFRCNANIAPG